MKDVVRLRYFDNEFLDAADFEVEQEYHRSMRYWHTRHFHTWGLAHNGLEVDYAEGQNKGEETKVVIYPGIGLDNEGREIVLTESRILDFDQPQYKMGKSYYITIRWHEQHGLPRQGGEHKRWVENPHIDVIEEMPERPDMELMLARVKLKEKRKLVETIDGSMRTYAAHEVGDKTVSSVKIVMADGESGQDITWGSGIKTAHLQDEAVTIAKLSEDARRFIIPVGCVDAFAMETAPGGWLECNGQAIDRDEYERLFKVIGTTFGAGNGETTFNVPDLRGRFVRGWAHGSDNDPDRDNRTSSASGGASADQVGSYQSNAFEIHKHNFQGKSENTGWQNQRHYHRIDVMRTESYFYDRCGWVEGGKEWFSGVNTTNEYGSHNHSFIPKGSITNQTTGRASSETRPKNIYLMYCIKY